MIPDPETPPAVDRHPNGRFAIGNHIGTGNYVHKKMHALRSAALRATTAEQVAEVLDAMRREALGGDSAAAKVYLENVLGKPSQAVQVSGPDGRPLGVNLNTIQIAILSALGDDSEAKFRVARALVNLGGGGPVDADGEGDVP